MSAVRRKTVGRRAAAKALKAATPESVLRAAFAVGRLSALDLAADAPALASEFLRTVAELLPGRSIALRLVDPRTLRLIALEAVGAPQPGIHRAPITLKPSAIRNTRLPESIAASGQVEASARYPLLFEATGGGFAVPITAGGRLHGAINVELPPVKDLAALLAADEAVVIPLANQLALALRNLGLRAETEQTQARLASVIARADVLIGLISGEGEVLLASDALCDFLAITRDELRAVRMDEWLRRHPDAPEPRLGALILRSLDGEAIDAVEAHTISWGGETRRAVWTITPLRSAGAIDSVIVVGHDVERIRQLERQVTQSEKLATVGQLAAGVVHELNNPLTSIGVYADYLAKKLERSDPADADKARRVLDAAARIRRLTQELMSLARPASDPAPLDVNEVLLRSLSLCEHVAAQARVRLEAVYGDALPRVLGRFGQLEQVLINLITNAVQAAAEAGGAVRAATAIDGRRVLITVADDGAGIPPDAQSRVFEPFFTTKKEGQGTGLGLSIVKNLIEAHGGTIRFDTSPSGTIFTVALPAL